MKKTMLFATGVAVLIASVYFGNPSAAQQKAGATQVQGTKIGVVNVGLIFAKYKRSVAIKNQLEDSLKKPREEAKTLVDQIVSWEKQLKEKQLSAREKDGIQENIYKNRRRLDDLNHEITKKFGKQSEENLVELWKEINMGIEAVAKAYGFQIVLGYGDPVEKETLNLLPNIQRRMTAVDQGSTIPLYIHGSVDLSNAVADTLNHWLKQKQVTPTSGR